MAAIPPIKALHAYAEPSLLYIVLFNHAAAENRSDRGLAGDLVDWRFFMGATAAGAASGKTEVSKLSYADWTIPLRWRAR
jgi:hypothetical protein